MADPEVKSIREYVWAKYIDYAHGGDDIDEARALAKLEKHHREHTIADDGETYYLGILYFEQAFAKSEADTLYLARAQRILEQYLGRSGESGWEAIDDRIEEARDALADIDDAVRTELIAKVDAELAEMGGDAAPAPATPAEPSVRVEDGMVFVPGGTFLAGDANTAREVKPFWIDEYPVTNAQYKQFVQATGYRSPKFWSEGRLNDPEQPVVGVSWYDAFKFAAFAGKSLPTKDQWEKAVRGAKGKPYPWGDELSEEHANFGQPDATDAVTSVDAHPTNVSEYGVRGAVGNVWEWTESPDPADGEQRVICGGSWCDPQEFVRCDTHLAAYPKDKYDNIGFRCVRTAD